MKDPILQFFAYAHLSADKQVISRPFGVLAAQLVLDLPNNPERHVALRKLLEAKDAAVRASFWQHFPNADTPSPAACGAPINQAGKEL